MSDKAPDENPQAIPAEESADWAMLDAAAGGDQPAPDMPEPPDPAEEWAMLPAVLGSILAIGLPEVREVYSEANCKEWGRAMVPVAEKYGWDSGLLGPEVGLLAASAPMVIGTAFAIRSRRAAKHEPAPSEAPAQEPAPGSGSKSVIIGGVPANG